MSTFKFSPFQRAWLDALKSGRYRQGEGCLASQTQNKKVDYCCLGVACVVQNATQGLPKLKKVHHDDSNRISFDGRVAWLPANTQTLLGLRTDTGAFNNAAVINSKEYLGLTQMNDGKNSHGSVPILTHKQIAEYIEANPENVFVQPT